jgi:hypothetical protein
MEVSGQLHAPDALPSGKEPWYPFDRKLGGPQSRSIRGGEEKNSQPRTDTIMPNERKVPVHLLEVGYNECIYGGL